MTVVFLGINLVNYVPHMSFTRVSGEDSRSKDPL